MTADPPDETKPTPTLRDRLAAKRRAERGERDLYAMLPTGPPPKIVRVKVPSPHPNRVDFRTMRRAKDADTSTPEERSS